MSHEGSLTGAPMALLHLVRWLRDNSRIEPEVAILRDGPLTAQFEEVGPTTVLGTEADWPAAEQRRAPAARQGPRQGRPPSPGVAAPARRRTDRGARAVYLNSAASVRLLHHLPRADAVIAHVHELRSALGWSLPPLDQELVRRRVDHVIAAADCVADNLVRQLGLARTDITRIYEFIDPPRVLAPPERDRTEVLASLGIPPDALVVGGSGWADWRKGIDLFTQLARDIDRRGRDDVHLLWVGGLPGGDDGEQIAFDAAQAGGRLHLVGLQSRPHDWYRAFDVLALTSREDPYPLVGLEAGLLEVPLICFDRSGGMTELVRRSVDEGLGESGVVVPYLDVEAMADAALDLLDDPGRRGAMGSLAATVVERDHQVAVAGPQVLEVIERVLAGAP